VGFGYSTRAATWWRVVDGVPMLPDPTSPASPVDAVPSGLVEADLTEVYELVGFDGARELRWRKDGDGRGNAVVLADSTDQLPTGGDDTSRGAATALPGTRTRMLAGKVEPLPVPGWVRLSAARYAPAVLPLDLAPGTDLSGSGAATPVVVVDAVEYVEEDEHGNTGVVDRRLTRLRLADHDELRLHLTDEED
jgi:CRISPR-associated protein (TIGR03984 family)